MGSSVLADYPILYTTVRIAFFAFSISLLVCLYRIIKGPTLADRAISLDAVGVNTIALITLYSMKQNTTLYMSAVLVLAILGFLSMVVLAEFIQQSSVVLHPDKLHIIHTKKWEREGDEKW